MFYVLMYNMILEFFSNLKICFFNMKVNEVCILPSKNPVGFDIMQWLNQKSTIYNVHVKILYASQFFRDKWILKHVAGAYINSRDSCRVSDTVLSPTDALKEHILYF